MKYETVIGLEVHVELKTNSKLFCGCSTSFGSEPNTHCCPVCLGMPGSLPVLNRRALELMVRSALALKCKIPSFSRFDRKNYFYPDLPKAYQISQLEYPIGEMGVLKITLPDGDKEIKITRVHLEEEAGKLIHPGGSIMNSQYSYVDYNRAGIPLMEIVSEPDISSPAEAYAYLQELRLILLYAGVSDCRMEEGSLRCDANVSLRPAGASALGTKVEVKNMNSFRAVEQALIYEVKRQKQALEKGDVIQQETRHWDENSKTTSPLRGKEEASDYRYFPEPDLPPVILEESYIKNIAAAMPELPAARRSRYQSDYALDEADIAILMADTELAAFYERAAASCDDYRALAKWTTGEVLRLMHSDSAPADGLESLNAQVLGEIIALINRKLINRLVAKEILPAALIEGKSPAALVKEKGLAIVGSAEELEPLVAKVIEENPIAVESYRNGKEKSFGFLVGKVMALTKGRAEPALVNKLLKEKLR